ncbi:hypothetical protein [Janthinobacterium agaricidamnosum]|nr:hypothetical protein [Janthinobacterium agaricidamnosum]
MTTRPITNNGVKPGGGRQAPVQQQMPIQLEPNQVLSSDLSSREQSLSLERAGASHSDAGAELTRWLGNGLTTRNKAWAQDPLPDLRALQKLLLAKSLATEGQPRAECLAAIKVVELNVQWRLRMLQMDMDSDMAAANGAAKPADKPLKETK